LHNLKEYPDLLTALITNVDIVLLHWYNNPVLYEFLILNILPPCRLVIWAHANNLYPPYVIPERLVDMCDRFIFTSPVSYQAKEYQQLSDKQKEKFDVIWSVADMEKFYAVKKVPHEKFNIGYAGTIDFNSKLHPDFVDLCAAIDIPNVHFIVCSSGPDLDKLKQQVADKSLIDKFTFTGRVDDLAPWFAQMDVFGYPLYEKHYGTCEQVLGEAMAAGIVPVVLDNEPEKFIDSIITAYAYYPKKIEDLYKYRDELDNYSQMAKESAHEIYDTDKMLSAWTQEFTELMWIGKSRKSWFGKRTGSFLLLESLGQYAKAFRDNDRFGIIEILRKNRQWASESKGSIKQYANTFPEDEMLKEWHEILKEIK
jgi:glycosyltransferase involved in cell wall biosynthesis